MLIRKTAGFFLAALLLAASALGIVAAFPSRTATADAPATLTTDNASLFLPDSYEQYLALENPTDVAVCEEYIAVADENHIYVFSRKSGKYSVYTNGSSSSVQINKIQFSNEGRLYFVNTAMNFYELKLDTMIANNNKLYSLSTFFISGDTIYAATSTGKTQLRKLALDGTSQTENVDPFVDDLSATPCITYADGVLYYTVGNAAYEYSFETKQASNFILDRNGDGTTQNSISSICAYGDRLYYTNPSGLFVSDKNGNATALIKGNRCSAVTIYNGMLYCVKEKSVVQYDIEAEKFTDYEIASASSSTNRLSGATECARAGNLLVTADAGNNRISVYDFSEKSFVTLPCENVKTVATDGEIIAAATDTKIFIYGSVWDADNRTFVLGKTGEIDRSNVVGVVCVYGTFYYVTQDFHYGKIVREGDEWVATDKQRDLSTTPKAITADLFGDIYVADSDGNVYELHEEDFGTEGELGSPMTTIDKDFSSLRAGFDGKLYYLDGSKNFCVNDGESVTVNGANFVYTDDDSIQPVSFALGYEDDEVYFCFGDFIVKSNAGELTKLGLATLETLSETVLRGAEETLSAVADAENVQLVDCNPGAVGVHGNLSALQGGGAFAAGYKRYTEARRGVVLDAQADYSLVAVYDGHVYTAEIFRNEDVGEPFSPKKEDGENAVMYLSSDCPAYHFPCIAEAPARAGTLARGTRVTVISYLDGNVGEGDVQGGYPFAYIEYETKTRSVARGYVPVSYLTDADPLGDTETRYTLGYVKPGATFTGSDGSEVVNEERVQARLYQNEDGTYTATYEKDGVSYTATVEEGQIEWGESDAWRIALIVILSVVAVLIIGGYVFLIPWNKKRTK